ncbi:RIP metalloprotease RseP [Pedobacter flavus]|uniref:Zinc metalloprotease n=1 Tax=Pedobacter flavus TaxID=3113906 RepID=A0ABU7H3Y5_9SPHI|nr:RIP metalloprotease RseP [Pedobacter sp. VNH31]MEE1885933.1 RIP metalloprotease RseP [Pedobacter sp. VNH31]
MDGLIMAGQLLLGLSILVILHELGHFLAARAFGIKVEKFYLFFDAYGIKLFKFKYGDTEYGIGWLPLGGYVKIAGMIDESMDTEQMEQPIQPWEFRAKPAWQRLIVMLGGIIVNIIVGCVIFWIMTFKYGQTYTPNSSVVNGIHAGPVGKEIGLQNGDKIIAINGQKVLRFEEIKSSKVLLDKTTLTVVRGNKTLYVKVPDDFLNKIADAKGLFVEPRLTSTIDSIIPNSASAKAGLMKGDKIVSINGKKVNFQDQVKEIITANKNSTAKIAVLRNNDVQNFNVRIDSLGTIGYYPFIGEIKRETTHFGFFEAFPIGVKMAANSFMDNVKGIGKILKGDASARNISSPIGIAKIYGSEFDWINFWSLTALISIGLAFMNLLPIPALDGGHVVFLLIEMIKGSPVSDVIMEKAQIAGFLILISLMIFAFGNDILKFFGI